ncbi:hypothetical protein BH11PSE10_BH11PSE10_18110 [soil metagenome]
MNANILKWLSSGLIGLVVLSALWLAGSVAATSASPPRVISLNTPVRTASLYRVALPVERAASAAMVLSLGLR